MPRRIDVELTSQRDDGTWTWRAAGALKPRGVLDGGLLFAGAKVGDVVRAEADIDVDGITVVSVLPPKEARREPERLELIVPERTDEQFVTASLATRSRDDRGPRRDRGERGDRGDRRDKRDRPEGKERTDRRERRPAGDRPPRERRPDEPAGERPARPPRERPARPARPPRERPEDTRPKPKRLRAGRTHRKAVLEGLPPEQRPIAEQVLLGGIPAVRQAVEKQNEALRGEGKPEVKAEPLVGIAEQLLPRLRTAEWRDRADAALADLAELDLRDLRSVVVAADAAARDDETRALAAQLREGLARRVEEEHNTWLNDLSGALKDGRVVRALRLSSRPPKAGSILPAELTAGLADAAGAALTADIASDRWTTVLDAIAYSPVRRAVTPSGYPGKAERRVVGHGAQAGESHSGAGGRVRYPAAARGTRRPRPGPSPRGRRWRRRQAEAARAPSPAPADRRGPARAGARGRTRASSRTRARRRGTPRAGAGRRGTARARRRGGH